MQTMIFTNSKGKTMLFDYTGDIAITDIMGLSGVTADLYSTKGYQQDGQTDAGQFLQPRSVSFNIRIKGRDMPDIYKNRGIAASFFNPKEKFTVIYSNEHALKRFTCRVSTPPEFSSQSGKASMVQHGQVSLICDDPFLYDVLESEVKLSQEEPAFSFPLYFPDEEGGKAFGTISNRIIINNVGDVETPVRIRFAGGITNPTIINETADERISVNQEIGADVILEITTGYGNKRVWFIDPNGNKSNAFNYIDAHNSTFFNLAVGENVLAFYADSGADTAACYIYYSNRYLGV